MKIFLLALLLVASCRTDFYIIDGRVIICTVCGGMTVCNPG